MILLSPQKLTSLVNNMDTQPMHFENHKKNRLSDIILGGQDGLVNVLGVILGVAAASQDTRIVLAGGLAAVFAESISMGAVAYTSKMTERDFYLSEHAREKREIHEVPQMERDEIRQIYAAKGFKGKLLEDVVKVITSDEKIWLNTMMNEELQLSPVAKKEPFSAAVIVFFSTIVGSFIPIIPFFFLPIHTSIWTSLAMSAIALFIVGAIKAKLTVGNWGKSGLEIAIIGIVSALAGYGIGWLFNATSS